MQENMKSKYRKTFKHKAALDGKCINKIFSAFTAQIICVFADFPASFWYLAGWVQVFLHFECMFSSIFGADLPAFYCGFFCILIADFLHFNGGFSGLLSANFLAFWHGYILGADFSDFNFLFPAFFSDFPACWVQIPNLHLVTLSPYSDGNRSGG